MQSLRLLLLFCCTTVCSYMCSGMEFDAAFDPVTHSLMYCKPSCENAVVVSVSDHLWSPLQDIFAPIAIKWYQTVLQSPVKLEFPNSIKLKKKSEASSPAQKAPSIIWGTFQSQAALVLGRLYLGAAGLSSFQSSFFVFCNIWQPKKVLPISSIRIESHAVSGTAWKESKYCVPLSATSLCCGLVFLVKDAAWF